MIALIRYHFVSYSYFNISKECAITVNYYLPLSLKVFACQYFSRLNAARLRITLIKKVTIIKKCLAKISRNFLWGYSACNISKMACN